MHSKAIVIRVCLRGARESFGMSGFFLVDKGKIDASEIVDSLKILGIDISKQQADKILQRSATMIISSLVI